MDRVRGVLLTGLLAAGLLPAAPVAADDDLPVTTSVREVEGAKAVSGTSTLLSYVLEHDVRDDVAPDTSLPGARVDRADHPDAFDGLWMQGGQVGAWFGGPSDSPNSQFRPRGTLLENLYVENEVWRRGEPLGVGDYAELALATAAMNTPTPWDRARGEADGQMEWDHTVTSRRITASYGEDSGTMDVIMFRADMVARGGDVDARPRVVQLPPLVFDLPQIYPDSVSWSSQMARSRPYTSYVEQASALPLPQAGKVVVQGSVRGYIPEASTYGLPNGTVMHEWRIPVLGVVVVTHGDTDLPLQSMVTLPDGGTIAAADADGVHELDAEPGESVLFSDGVAALVDDGPDGSEPGFSRASAGHPDDYTAAAAIDHRLDEPVELNLATGRNVTVDPDYLGQGLLALRQPANERGGLVDLYAAPAVLHDGGVVPLTRDRLVGLRVVPARPGGAVATYLSTLPSDDPLTRTSTVRNQVWFQAGLLVEAVYDLGDGVHAFLAAQMSSRGISELPRGRLSVATSVRSIDSRPIDAWPIQFLLLPEAEAAVQGNNEHTTEFSGPAYRWVTADDRRASSDYWAGAEVLDGTVHALRGPAPVTGRAPDPDTPLAGAPLALVYLPPVGAPAVRESFTSLWAGPASAPPAPEANPPPLGQPCGTPQVTDLPTPTSLPATDLRAAWFDADDANLYATIQVSDLPGAAPDGTALQWALRWRDEHGARVATATLDDAGNWTFRAGLTTSGGAVDGEVRTGPDGLVRLAIPRNRIEDGYADGTVIRDVGAHSYAGFVRVDHAPKGSDTQWGLGGEYVVGSCD